MSFQIGKNADVYSFADQYKHAQYPLYAMFVSDVPRHLIHPETMLELPAFGIADCKVPSYEHLHRLVHNMRAIADLNKYEKICQVSIEENKPEPSYEDQPPAIDNGSDIEATISISPASVSNEPVDPEFLAAIHAAEEAAAEKIAEEMKDQEEEEAAVAEESTQDSAPKRRGRKPKQEA